jgi:hypothetical protein
MRAILRSGARHRNGCQICAFSTDPPETRNGSAVGLFAKDISTLGDLFLQVWRDVRGGVLRDGEPKIAAGRDRVGKRHPHSATCAPSNGPAVLLPPPADDVIGKRMLCR